MPRDPRRTAPASPATVRRACWAAVLCQALAWSTGAAISHPIDVGGTRSVEVPEGAACDEQRPLDCNDGNPCNGQETCQEGICRPGVPPSIGDGNPCTIDVCDPLTGGRHLPVEDGTPCNDPYLCYGDGTCRGGICTGGLVPDCDDGDPCTLDTCRPAYGCRHAPDPECPGTTTTTLSTAPPTTTTTLPPVPCTAESCDDGDPCTVDGCRSGRCVNDEMEGLPSVTCVCQRPELAPCLGEQLPRRIARSLARACNALGKATEVRRPPKVTRLVGRAAARWREAGRLIGTPRAQLALSQACMRALEGALLDARTRSERLIGAP